MALDAITISIISGELQQVLLGARVDKIHMPSKEEVLFLLRTRQESFRLLVGVRSGGTRVCITDEPFENPDVPPSYCMLLRKYLNGAKLRRIYPVHGERILNIEFAATNELGDGRILTLAVELMGRYANLVLFDEQDKIIDALKRIDFEASEQRQLLTGLTYVLPHKADKPYFLDVTARELAQNAAQYDDVHKGIMSCSLGIGPIVAREVDFRATNSAQSDRVAAIEQAVLQLQQDAASGAPPVLIKNEKDEPCEFCFFVPQQFPADYTLIPYASFSLLLRDYYAEKEHKIRLSRTSGNLLRQVTQILERTVRRQAAREQELAKSEKSEQSRLFGELLAANMHMINKGDGKAEVLNYYSGDQVTIPLDKRLTPAANSQKYYSDYRKKQTAQVMLTKLLEQGERELEYLRSVQYTAGVATSEAELLEIRQELKAGGYLKSFKLKNKKQKKADFLRFLSVDGYEILVGRNNAQNEKLSVKTARGKDMWFHVKSAPGSHVVVLSRGDDIPLASQNEAAQLAVHFSSQKGGNKVPVDHTMVKNLKKTSDLPLGMVIYHVYETAFVTEEPQVLDAVMARKP